METPEYVKRADTGAKRMMLFAGAILVIAVIAAVATMVGGGGSPEEMVDTWLEHVGQQEYEEAYAMLSTDCRSSVDLEAFRAAASDNVALDANQGMSSGSSLSDDEKTLTGLLATDSGSRRIEVRFDIETGWFAKSHAIADVKIDDVSAIHSAGGS